MMEYLQDPVAAPRSTGLGLAFGFLARFLGVPAEDAAQFLQWSRGIAELIMQPHADEAGFGRGVAELNRLMICR